MKIAAFNFFKLAKFSLVHFHRTLRHIFSPDPMICFFPSTEVRHRNAPSICSCSLCQIVQHTEAPPVKQFAPRLPAVVPFAVGVGGGGANEDAREQMPWGRHVLVLYSRPHQPAPRCVLKKNHKPTRTNEHRISNSGLLLH